MSSARRRQLPRTGSVLAGTVLTALSVAGALLTTGSPATAALFTGEYPIDASIATGRIFSAERVSTAFAVTDVSSGAAVDASSTSAFAADGLFFVSRPWSAAFAADRYLDLDLNGPLPAGLVAADAQLDVRLASDAGTGSVCVHVEIRRASTDALLSAHGSAGSPLACTSTTAWTTLTVALPAVADTDAANDLRVRLFASDSAGGAMRLDMATVAGATPYASFTLYPILTREAFDGQVELLRWGLAGP